MGWGEEHSIADSSTGTTMQVSIAREALYAVGIEGDTLADQALRAACRIQDLLDASN